MRSTHMTEAQICSGGKLLKLAIWCISVICPRRGSYALIKKHSGAISLYPYYVRISKLFLQTTHYFSGNNGSKKKIGDIPDALMVKIQLHLAPIYQDHFASGLWDGIDGNCGAKNQTRMWEITFESMLNTDPSGCLYPLLILSTFLNL